MKTDRGLAGRHSPLTFFVPPGRPDKLLTARSNVGIRLTVNRSFAKRGLGSGMVRIVIVVALLAMTLAGIGSLVPGAPPLGDATAAGTAVTAPTASLGLPSVDLMSFGLGAFVGLILGWIWALPWRNLGELSRELFVRTLRGFGVVGIAMVAAAVLLFY
jgi:hypothetical protein